MLPQPAILAPVPPAGRSLVFTLAPDADPRAALARVRALPVDDAVVLGLGAGLLAAGGAAVPVARVMPTVEGVGVRFPSTPGDVWALVRGDDGGQVLHHARRLVAALAPELVLAEDTATFRYADGRDLTGYEDGTENPTGDDAFATAFIAEGPLAGSSVVAVQRWTHQLDVMAAMSDRERDHVIGRDRVTNEELADAPPSAHVKRAAQEDFEPAAFMVRRSMPWGDVGRHGLVFIAFAASLDPFEAVLRRMAGLDDGVTDALLRFSAPETGAAFWCPAVVAGRYSVP